MGRSGHASRGSDAATPCVRLAWFPWQVVALAVRVLPPSQRARYHAEFDAELCVVQGWAQYRYAAGVLLTAWWLRRAVDDRAVAGSVPDVPLRPVPLLCRSNVRHSWGREFPGEGRPYIACTRCGRESTGPLYHPSQII